MIEQIGIGKTSAGLREFESSLWSFGSDPQITIPASGLHSVAHEGLTEDRTRSHTQSVKDLLASRAATTEGLRHVASLGPEDR
ncbi:hypothetical protein PE067_05505 [Paracoccus sp. DMF-8]|uniref:hypothetical protein n=1 Tax=Paracoccus sp. DMF-8 TaxID=3019445 RepID=UPI0023E84F2B|nr:hypothetical protein [Paracoccus sp. DMF-8]MDF3605650.1 hypothetical protein [Paracoccus sp. DMF-8]